MHNKSRVIYYSRSPDERIMGLCKAYYAGLLFPTGTRPPLESNDAALAYFGLLLAFAKPDPIIRNFQYGNVFASRGIDIHYVELGEADWVHLIERTPQCNEFMRKLPEAEQIIASREFSAVYAGPILTIGKRVIDAG